MVYISSTPPDKALAERLRADLFAAGFSIENQASDDPKQVIVLLLSEDKASESAMLRALDASQHIIPVNVHDAPPPELIRHLGAVDMSADYDAQSVIGWIKGVTAPGAPPPVRVLTPKQKKRNKRIGAWLAGVALLWFIIGIILVGVYGIHAPVEEYNTDNTIVAATVDNILEQYRPRSTEDALNFDATVQAAPRSSRPLLAATATAQAKNG